MDNMTFVLFGGTGDLAKRKIYPALFNLYIDKKMPETFSIIALGRKETTHAEFQQVVAKSLETFSRRAASDEAQLKAFLETVRYAALDAEQPGGFQQAAYPRGTTRTRIEHSGQPRLFYLSVAPEFFETIAFNIKDSGLGSTT